MVFDCLPSNIQEVYWKCTHNDIKVKLKLYLGARNADHLQFYQSLGLIVSQAFGGKKSSASEGERVPQTREEMTVAFKDVFG